MFGPDMVVTEARTFDAVVIGSGDREHPLSSSTDATATANRAYMFARSERRYGRHGSQHHRVRSRSGRHGRDDTGRPLGPQGLVHCAAQRREDRERTDRRGERHDLRHEPALCLGQVERERRLRCVRYDADLYGKPRRRAALRRQLPHCSAVRFYGQQWQPDPFRGRGGRWFPSVSRGRGRDDRRRSVHVRHRQSAGSRRRDHTARSTYRRRDSAPTGTKCSNSVH